MTKRPKWKLTWRKTWPLKCWMNTLSFWSNIYKSWARTTLISFVHSKRTSNSHKNKLIQCLKLFISICRLNTLLSSSCVKGRRKTWRMKLKNWKSDKCQLMRRNWYCSSWKNWNKKIRRSKTQRIREKEMNNHNLNSICPWLKDFKKLRDEKKDR